MGKTRGVHETTPELRNRMVGMYEAGLGLREIAAAINCSQRTVKRWLNRFDKEGTVETRERCGRKRATTSEQDEAIVRLATQTPITAAKAVLPALGLNCSVDTVRERLHKAGIHNWSPSRKHIQRIPLGQADGAAIQQAVWRPTGTQLGKKKNNKNQTKSKNINTSKVKKKKIVKKVKEKEPEEFIETQSVEKSTERVITYDQPQNLIHCNDLPPLDHPNTNINNQGQFNGVHSELYNHVPDMNINQNWPLDLVQSNQNQYIQNQGNLPPPSSCSQLQELYPHNNHLDDHLQQQLNPPINVNETIKPPDGSESSNSNSSDDNSQVNINDNEVKDTSEGLESEKSKDDSQDSDSKKKKGGKAKGTLETSVELRNRMIGMSQAGLSTLSIALAINRSERTVKRWLERWKKEGNVQTKERKGRRRITTKEQDEAIIAMATQNPLTAAKHVAPALGLKCSVDTIRERLHKAGIHSWKLGKKQGEGNAVHTVHLWQPSGNRPNRPRILRKSNVRKSNGKKGDGNNQKSMNLRKKNSKKQEEKIIDPPNPVVPVPTVPVESIQPPQQAPTIQQNSIQFHDNNVINNYNNSNSNVLQPVGILGSLNPSSSGQQIHTVGPVMRPDCRMATSQVPGGYSSCMVANGGHMEQPDPLNYEPYIWNF